MPIPKASSAASMYRMVWTPLVVIRDKRELRRPDQILQHNIAIPLPIAQFHARAGIRPAVLLLVRKALVVHDVPKRIRIRLGEAGRDQGGSYRTMLPARLHPSINAVESRIPDAYSSLAWPCRMCVPSRRTAPC